MKKKMKKSRSIKLTDIESLRSSTLKKTISQPGKPPPLNVLTAAAVTPQKQSPARITDGSPNYMKSTSSSEARKESLQVSSSRYSQTGSDCKNLSRRSSNNSKLSSGASSKPARSSTKSSSLKLVRTLTKTPSFKPVRPGTKKCSRVVICADMNAQRGTCSSTLKDSKFPAYLTLNPGATEAEGTSAVKVCPYTFCSLNGHHHTPLPPLKCFLSTRRRLLKTQKSMKLEALSPRRVEPVAETDAGKMIFYDKPGYEDGELDNSPRSPLIREGGMDFFIEIYAKNKEHSNNDQIAENLSDESPHSEIDFENAEQYSDITPLGVDITEGFLEEETVEDPDKGYSNEGLSGNCYSGSDLEDGSNASSEENDGTSEVSDMEWEEGQFPILEADAVANDLIKDDDESDLDDGCLSEIVNLDLHVEPVSKADNIVINCSEKILVDEIFEEDSACCETQQGDSDSEMNDAEQNLEIVESHQVYYSDQESSTEEAETDSIGVIITSAWTEEPTVSIEEIRKKNGIVKAENETNEISPQFGDVETLNDRSKDISLQDDELTMLLQNQISGSFQNSDETDEDYNGSQESEDSKADKKVATSEFGMEHGISNNEAEEQMEEKAQVVVTKKSIGVQVPDDLFELYEDDHNIINPCQLEDSTENINSSQDIVDEKKILSAESQEHPLQAEYDSIDVAENQTNLEKDEFTNLNVPSSMDSEEQSHLRMNRISLAESGIGGVEKVEVEDSTQSDETETLAMTDCKTIPEIESTALPSKNMSNQEVSSSSSNQKWGVRSKRAVNDEEELRNFNPREPNFLPIVPDPDAEKVDLKHQMMDERKNSEEWMVDYALRQAVTKLGPARKRKVALLVEAFETVIPVPKCETRIRHSSGAFAPARPIQACS